MIREGRVLLSSLSKPSFGSSCVVTAYEPGAQVASGSASTTITVRTGHGFASGDKLIVGTDVSRYRTVQSVTSTTIVTTQAVSVSAGEVLVNLGQDTGTATPNYDGSGLTIYSDMAYANAYADESVSADSTGRYRYYHKGLASIWELVHTAAGVPIAVYEDVFQGDLGSPAAIRVAHLFSADGSGTSSDPWVGWEGGVLASISAGSKIRFGAGYYSTAGFSVPVTLTNEPSQCVIEGDGSALVFITVTSATGQFRVYGSGAGTRVLDGSRVTGLTIFAGVTNTSAGLFSVENFDIGSYVDDIRVDPTAASNVAVGIQVLNCENCHFGFLEVRGRVVTVGAVGHVETGLKIYTDDGIQRGDMHFDEVHVTDVTTGLSISSSGGSLNNLYFGVFKAVNPSVVNGTLGVSIASNAEQITFGNIMLEALANGLDASGVENIRVVNGLASQIHNVANNAGAAFTITNGDGGSIFCRIDTVFNGFVLAGTTTRYYVQATAAGTVSGTYFSDTSSGSNFYLSGNVATSAFSAAGRFTSTGGFSIGTRVAAGLIATGVLTLPASPTSNNFTVDTEAAASTDDLDTLSGGFDGAIVVLSAADDSRTVVVKNNTGNIKCGADRTLDNSLDTITLQKVGSNWVQLAFSDNGA